SYDWLQEWSPGQVFNNTFLVRKPHMPAAFLTLEDGYEQAIAPDAADSLALMERTFIDSPGVCRHIHQPADAWKAMLAIGDGGMERISNHLALIAGLDYKLARLDDQLESTLDALTHHGLGRWYHSDGSGEQEAKNRLSSEFMRHLQTPALSELLHYMALPDATLRDLYLSDDDSPSTESAEDAKAKSPRKSLYGNAGGGFFGQPAAAASTAQTAPVRESADHRFARAAFNAWVEHMRALPRRDGLLHLLELDQMQATVENLCDELITGAHRLGVPEKLSRALLQRVQSGARRDRLVDRHVLTAQRMINDYVAWRGLQELPMDQRPTDDMVSGAPLFGYEADVVLPGEQPTLPTAPTDQASKYLGHWLQAACHLTRENTGHSSGRELSVAQNERLGRILDTLSGRPVANDTLTHKEPAHG
ncbi:MAG: virulence factor SrfC family protein, partial [Halomonadaceae bacterium]